MTDEVFRLYIPADGRRFINANDRGHWRQRSERTKLWRHFAYEKAVAGSPMYFEKVHITAELLFADTRRRDPANWAPTAKACVDGFVDAGMVYDDSSKYVVGPDMRIGEKVARDNIGIRFIFVALVL